jgi:hypothetical protein
MQAWVFLRPWAVSVHRMRIGNSPAYLSGQRPLVYFLKCFRISVCSLVANCANCVEFGACRLQPAPSAYLVFPPNGSLRLSEFGVSTHADFLPLCRVLPEQPCLGQLHQL